MFAWKVSWTVLLNKYVSPFLTGVGPFHKQATDSRLATSQVFRQKSKSSDSFPSTCLTCHCFCLCPRQGILLCSTTKLFVCEDLHGWRSYWTQSGFEDEQQLWQALLGYWRDVPAICQWYALKSFWFCFVIVTLYTRYVDCCYYVLGVELLLLHKPLICADKAGSWIYYRSILWLP